MASSPETVRVGIVGLGRGQTFIKHNHPSAGMELVAICDTWQERLEQIGRAHGVATYTDFDEFITHDMDAVILANYYHEHAALAIEALRAGKHVMSETAACTTMAEGVALVRAVEETGLIYMLADQYPYMVFNQEMRRLYQNGTVGDFRYGEGEYIHPMSARFVNSISPGYNHWRNWLPATYYCSHALAPLMYITDTVPTSVNGFLVPHDPDDANKALTVRRMDTAGLIVLQMSNGAYVKLLQYDLRGEGNWVRVHGNRGLMENLRHGNTNQVRIRREPFEKLADEPVEVTYEPDFPTHHAEASQTSHGGGDFFMNYYFADAIRNGRQPYFDVYRGVTMAMVGILAYRSALNRSAMMDVPDLTDEDVRRDYENDHWTPDPQRRSPSNPSPSIVGEIEPPVSGREFAEEVWQNTDELMYGGKAIE